MKSYSALGATRALPEQLNESEALRNFAEAMHVAAECARQLAFLRQQPQWLIVQNAVEGARSTAMKMAQRSPAGLVLPPSYARMQ